MNWVSARSKTRCTCTMSMQPCSPCWDSITGSLTYFFQGRSRRLTDVGGDKEFSARLLQA